MGDPKHKKARDQDIQPGIADGCGKMVKVYFAEYVEKQQQRHCHF
jgi:hypothetical protein